MKKSFFHSLLVLHVVLIGLVSGTFSSVSAQNSYLYYTNNNAGWQWTYLRYVTPVVGQTTVTNGGNRTIRFYIRDINGSINWANMRFYVNLGGVDYWVTMSSYYSGSASWTAVNIPVSSIVGDMTRIPNFGFDFMGFRPSAASGTGSFGVDEMAFVDGATPFLWYGDARTNTYLDENDGVNLRVKSKPSSGGYATTYSGPFYVDDNSGSDSNDGSFTSPFLTIQKAVNRIASGVSVTSATCFVFPGTYSETVAISSNKSRPKMLVVKALSNTQPVLTGAGSLSYGFNVNRAISNVMIQGFLVKRFASRGLLVYNAALVNYSNLIVKGCSFYSNQYDTEINNTRNSLFTNNSFAYSTIGFWCLRDTRQNRIEGNTFRRLQQNGIYIQDNSGSHSNNFAYNQFVSNLQRGFTVGTTIEESLFYRNRFYRNAQQGAYFNSPTSARLYHNSFYSNGDVAFPQIYSSGGTIRIHNNIIFGSKNYGVHIAAGTGIASYNNAYQNFSGSYLGFVPGNGSISVDPRWNIAETPSANFLALSNTSTCIDAGTNLAYPSGYSYGGTAPDLGWKEASGTIAYYVDDDSGNDSNPGTFALPFRTVVKGVNSMMTNHSGPVACYVFPGTYNNEQVVFSSNRTGHWMLLTSLSNTRPKPIIHGTGTIPWGIRFDKGVSRVEVVGLEVRRYTTGAMEVFDATTSVRSNQIRKCSIVSNVVGIDVRNSKEITLSSNYFERNNQFNTLVRFSRGVSVYSNHYRKCALTSLYSVVVLDTSTNCRVHQNTFFSNAMGAAGDSAIKLQYAASNTVISNYSRISFEGINIFDADNHNNVVRNNEIRRVQETGMRVNNWGVRKIKNLRVIRNQFITNGTFGVSIQDGCSNVLILSNEIAYARGGWNPTGALIVEKAADATIARNVIYSNAFYGISIGPSSTPVSHALLINNTVYGSRAGGIYLESATTTATLYNNIVMSNAGYGINANTTGTVFYAYNQAYGNTSGTFNGSLTAGSGNLTSDPMLYTKTSFTLTSSTSPAVDSGFAFPLYASVYNGTGPDRGAKESGYTSVVPILSALGFFDPFDGCSTGGQTMTIRGTNFRPTQGVKTVTIGGVNATVLNWSNHVIRVTIPAAAQGPVQIWSNTEQIAKTRSASNIMYSPVAAVASAAVTPASEAIDGNLGTRWESPQSDPQWIYVDLGSIKPVNRVDLYWETAHSYLFLLQTTTNLVVPWETVSSNTNSPRGVSWWQTNRFTQKNARYVRMYGYSRASPWGHSIWEFIPRYERTNYSYPTAVSISSVSNYFAWPGDLIKITGSGFNSTRGIGSVSFGNVKSTNIQYWSDTLIRVYVPSGVKSGPLRVTNQCLLVGTAATNFTAGSNLFYVSKNNTAGPWNGLSWTTAFTTINAARDAMATRTNIRSAFGRGLTTLIAAGVYREMVELVGNLHSGRRGFTNTYKAYTNGVIIDANAANAHSIQITADTRFVTFRNLTVRNSTAALIFVGGSQSNTFSRIRVYRSPAGTDGMVLQGPGASYNNIYNCTFWSNAWAGINITGDDAVKNNIYNCIFMENNEGIFNHGTLGGNGDPVNNYNAYYANRNVATANVTTGANIFSADPLFASVNVSSPDFLALSSSSPYIDAGDPNFNSDPLRQGLIVDLGARESAYSLGKTIYVNKNQRVGPWDGLSWATAYTQIMGSAMSDFTNGVGNTMLVAGGIYREQVDIYNTASGRFGSTNRISGYTNGVIIDAENTRAYGIQLGPNGQVVHHIRIENVRVTRANTHGIRLMYSQSNVFSRLVADRNRNGNGWGMYLGVSRSNLIVNCTFVSNGARGVTIAADAFNNHVRNCIIYRNPGGIEANAGTFTTITYSDIVSNVGAGNFVGSVVPSVGMITNSPLFQSVDPSSASFVRLGVGSPCIDRGDPSDPVPSGGGSRVDMGAYEASFNTGPFYVDDNSGNDSNVGSFTSPFLTIQKAVNVMSLGLPTCSSATTFVFPGNYNEAVTILSNKNLGLMVITKLSNQKPRLTGNGALNIGITLNNADNVLVQGLNVVRYLQNGFYVTGSATNNLIRACLITSNATRGLYADGANADRNQVRSNVFAGPNQQNGIVFWGPDQWTVSSNQFLRHSDNGVGVVGDSQSNRIAHNLVVSNANQGIYIGDVLIFAASVESNACWGLNQNYGVRVNNARKIRVVGNISYKNEFDGIWVNSASNLFYKNTVYSNIAGSGLNASSSSFYNNVIMSNVFWGSNQLHGILITDGIKNRVAYNEIRRNRDSGIQLAGGSSNNIIVGNTLVSNTIRSMYLNGAACDRNSILSNVARGPGSQYGLTISSASHNDIRWNTFHRFFYATLYPINGASSNRIIRNTFYSNNESSYAAAVDLRSGTQNVVNSNLFHRTKVGVSVYGAKYAQIAFNTFDRTSVWAFRVTDPASYGNRFHQNFIKSNAGAPIMTMFGSSNTMIISNVFRSNTGEPLVLGGSQGTVFSRNLLDRKYSSWAHALHIDRATNVKVLNNTIYGGNNGGIRIYNMSSATLLNNIILSNRDGTGNDYAILNESDYPVYAAYNCIYGWGAAPTNRVGTGLQWGPGNIFSDPMLDTVSSFTIQSPLSPVIDMGLTVPLYADVFNGFGPDMGWKESTLVFTNRGPFFVDDDSGNNSYPGTFRYPFRSIQKAAQVMMPGLPTCTVASAYVFPGMYSEKVAIRSNKNVGMMVITKMSNTRPTMSGLGGTNFGVKVTNAGNILIRGFALKRYVNGIQFAGVVTNVSVLLSTVFSNSTAGINVSSDSADRNSVVSNVFLWNATGINLQDGDRWTIRSNNINNSSQYGISMQGTAVSNIVTRNMMRSNTLAALFVNGSASREHVVASNVASGFNQNTPFIFTGSGKNVIRNNSLSQSLNYGISIDSASNTILGNRICSNAGWGGIFASAEGFDNNVILSNLLSAHIRGIVIADGDNNLISGNTILRHSESGMIMTGVSTNNTFSFNSLLSNTQNGIWFDSDNADRNRVIYNLFSGSNQGSGLNFRDADRNAIRSNTFRLNKGGFYLSGSSRSNDISGNFFISNTSPSGNTSGIDFNAPGVTHNMASSNLFVGHSYGISIALARYNTIRKSRFIDNVSGLRVANWSTTPPFSNTIVANTFSNNNSGLLVYQKSSNTLIISNRFVNNTRGWPWTSLSIQESFNTVLAHNLIKGGQYGINIGDGGKATNCLVINNTLYGNTTGGVLINNSSTATLVNNIFLSNRDGAGNDFAIEVTSGSAFAAFNVMYGWGLSATNSTGGTLVWGPYNVFGNPLLETVTSFTITSQTSVAVDAGNIWPRFPLIFNGFAPDAGWKESAFIITNRGPYFVDDDSGNNSYPGTFRYPFRSIQKAAQVMMPGLPNCTVASAYVFPGTYQERVIIRSNKNSGLMVIQNLSNTRPYMTGVGISNQAFKITNAQNIVLRGLSIYRYAYGINFPGNTRDIYLMNNVLQSNSNYAIYGNAETVDLIHVVSNSIFGRRQISGILIADGDQWNVRDNHISQHWQYGIRVNGVSSSNRFLRNDFISNISAGLYTASASAADWVVMSNNMSGPNQVSGADMTGGIRMLFSKNTARLNGQYGFVFSSTSYSNRIHRNTFRSNELYGLYVNGFTTSAFTVESNEAFGTNQNTGLMFSGGSRSILRNNNVHHHAVEGIYLNGGDTNIIVNNEVWSNNLRPAATSSGIYLYSSISNQVRNNHVWGGSQSTGIGLSAHVVNILMESNRTCGNGRGIVLSGNVTNVQIRRNVISSNYSYAGVWLNSGTMVSVAVENNFFGGRTQPTGVLINLASKVLVRSNIFSVQSNNGLLIQGSSAQSNRIVCNQFISNYNYGIMLNSSASNNFIVSNVIMGCRNTATVAGIRFSPNGTKIHRNLIARNASYGLFVESGVNMEVVNNTIYASGINHGVTWPSGSGSFVNNIVLSNGNGNDAGLYVNSPNPVYVASNCFFGNKNRQTNNAGGGMIWGNGNVIMDPMLETVTSYTISSVYSPAVDKAAYYPGVATVFNGFGPDMGWKESLFYYINYGPYYVDDESGSDLNPGTFARPFYTIQLAADKMAQGLPNCTAATAYIFPGIYTQSVRIVNETHKPHIMVFTALSNVKPVMTGGQGIKTNAFYITRGTNILIQNLVMKQYTIAPGRAISCGGGAATKSSNLIVRGCSIYSNSGFGLGLYYVNYSLFSNNDIANGTVGVFLENSPRNRIVQNRISRASQNGAVVQTSSHTNLFQENVFYSNINGLRINSGIEGTLVYRNRLAFNNQRAITLDTVGSAQIFHNSVYSNSSTPGFDQILITAGGPISIRNNILVAGGKHGISVRGGTVYASYNNVFSHKGVNYSNLSPGPGSISNLPRWQREMSPLASFLSLSNASVCIDAGTNLGYPFNSTAPDLGWLETTFTATPNLFISKTVDSISNVFNTGKAIPGSLITYSLTYSNMGNAMATNAMLLEHPSAKFQYYTNILTSVTGWTAQYSTNSNPSQIWNSPDYTTAVPVTGKTSVKWVRWKKSAVGIGEKGTLIFKLVIR